MESSKSVCQTANVLASCQNENHPNSGTLRHDDNELQTPTSANRTPTVGSRAEDNKRKRVCERGERVMEAPFLGGGHRLKLPGEASALQFGRKTMTCTTFEKLKFEWRGGQLIASPIN
uniref:Uncharacterized protein n=1 Tax=Anopheles atroparvus TaxID=41427 RepID=A0A182JB40_ANOAO